MLRAVPIKLMGVATMFGAIALLFAVPWLDTSKVRSMRYRPAARTFFLLFIAVTLTLGWCGSKEPDDVVLATGRNAAGDPTGLTVTMFSQPLALYYYAYFLVVLPVLGFVEKARPVPDTISSPVLSAHGHGVALPAGPAAEASKRRSPRPRWRSPSTPASASRARSASSTRAPCSGASRSTRRSARAATR